MGHIKRLCCSGVLGLNAPHGRSPHRLDNVRRRPFLDYLLAFRPAAMARSDIAPAACSSAVTGLTWAARSARDARVGFLAGLAGLRRQLRSGTIATNAPRPRCRPPWPVV